MDGGYCFHPFLFVTYEIFRFRKYIDDFRPLFVCLCVYVFVCVFVCRHDNSRTEEATNVKLHHVIQEGDG